MKSCPRGSSGLPRGVSALGAARSARLPPCPVAHNARRPSGVAVAPDAIVEVDEVVGGEGAVGPGVVGILAYAHSDGDVRNIPTQRDLGFYSMILSGSAF